LAREPQNLLALYLKAKIIILSTSSQNRVKIKQEILNLVNEMAVLAHSAVYYHRKWELLKDLNIDDNDIYEEQKNACQELLKIPKSPTTLVYHTIAEKFLKVEIKILRADFTADQTTGQSPLSVKFFDRSAGDPTSWTWQFGDGNTSHEANPKHTYQQDGQYTVTLLVANKAGSHSVVKTALISAGDIIKQESTKNPVLKSTSKSLDNVHFSVAGPKTAKPGSDFLLTFWAFLDTQRNDVLRRIYDSHPPENTRIHYKGPVKIEREKQITLFIEIKDLIIKQNITSIYWTGEITSEIFQASVPDNVVIGTKIGKISLLVEGMEISTIHFSLEITNSLTEVRSLPVNVRLHQNAFASYSKKDTKKVLARIQAMEIVAPWLKVYIDFDGIRAGQYWKDELKKSITDMDVFYLFWSENSAKSEWVKREWQCALNSKGLDYIQPVPLVNPDKVPPPAELSPKQFKDKWLCYIEWVNSTRNQEYLKNFIRIYERNAAFHF